MFMSSEHLTDKTKLLLQEYQTLRETLHSKMHSLQYVFTYLLHGAESILRS